MSAGKSGQELLLGIDVGTASSKGVLVTLTGEVLRSHVLPHGLSNPQPGHYEQDAEQVWWHDVQAICRELLSGEYSGDDVVGVAVSAIGPCLLPLDAAGQPLRPGILYGLDARAGEQISALETEIGAAQIMAFSGMALSSQAVGPKIRWLREQEPEVWAQTRILTSASSYLTYRLTGRHVLNRHEASHFMPLYDPTTGEWDARYEQQVGPLSLLPDLGWSDELAGHVTAAAAALTGLRAGTPVAVGAVDALSEALSVGVTRPGDLMIMYGSTTFFILVQDTPTPSETLWTVGGAYAGQFNLAAGMSTTGNLTGWFQRELAPGSSYADLFAAASTVPAGADGLLMLPYFSGERTPINDPQARGVVAGLTLAHTRDHLFRAVLEGVGYGVRHNLETFTQLGSALRRVVAVGGGAQSDTWLQIVSDISGAVQEVPATTIGASYGNAFLAGLAAKRLQRDDLETWIKPGRTIRPDPSKAALYDHQFGLYKTLYAQTKALVHELAAGQG
ncbi:FGGY-family carbohydrate kinase (plasmid) [Deinococcus sp. KNUC1210]|uniref:FGGY-family carbohydrate kinase n=1 Tax=Deinococcus sp. KNUC1210 TaxID=2917691 RepID=UPI001EF03E27|nr:FGGY-family carbohydrate kinase [Deinococcus sp. KNUC1210]ULH14198.1 FGGY-family carbohydrate kinase [Deinococcus sp. KNUC1210]